MISSQKIKQLCKRFQKDEDGQIAITMALSTIVLLGAMGAAIDYSALTNAESKAQSIADSLALTAAVYIKEHGEPPKNKQEGLIGTYTASELGFDAPGWVNKGAAGMTIEVIYDDEKGEANAIVGGKTLPSVSQILGHETLSFSAKSVVKYYEAESLNPASIVLVLDNSGSMAWYDKSVPVINNRYLGNLPSDAEKRIDGLQESVKSFMKTLEGIVEREGAKGSDKERMLRTGMLAYSSNTIGARTVQMNWGTISDSKINSMRASGATNPAPALKSASQWMVSEDSVHKKEHGNSPLKFAIFMTDGVNNTGKTVWVNQADTGYWRQETCNRGRCSYSYRDQSSRPSGSGWTEGKFKSEGDATALKECTALKNAGTTVFTIGYALEPGYKQTTTRNSGNRRFTYQDQRTTDSAYEFLTACASSPANFIKAENADSLKEVFDQIGKTVVQEVIRITA